MISVRTELEKAYAKKIPERIGSDDPTLTFQEFCLYYMLRWNTSVNDQTIDPQAIYENLQKGGWLQKTWLKMRAGKRQPMIFDKAWDQVF